MSFVQQSPDHSSRDVKLLSIFESWCSRKVSLPESSCQRSSRVSRLRERVASDSWLHQCHCCVSLTGLFEQACFRLLLGWMVLGLYLAKESPHHFSLLWVSLMEYICLSFSLSLWQIPERASFKHYSPSHAYCHQLPFVSSATDPSSELHEIKLRLLSCVTLPRRQKAWMNFTIHQTFSFLLLWLGPKSRRVHRTLVSASDATPTDLLQPVLSLMSYSYCTQNWKHFLIKSDWLAFHNVQETVCACVVFLSAWKRGWCTEHF